MAVTNANTVVVQNSILADGFPSRPELSPISYPNSILNVGMDITVEADSSTAVDVTHFGTVQRVMLKARSGTITYKLNGVNEEYTLNSFAIITQAITQLDLLNGHATDSGLVEVQIIGKTT